MNQLESPAEHIRQAEVHLSTLSESMRRMVGAARISLADEESDELTTLTLKVQTSNLSNAAVELVRILQSLRQTYARTDMAALDAEIDADLEAWRSGKSQDAEKRIRTEVPASADPVQDGAPAPVSAADVSPAPAPTTDSPPAPAPTVDAPPAPAPTMGISLATDEPTAAIELDLEDESAAQLVKALQDYMLSMQGLGKSSNEEAR